MRRTKIICLTALVLTVVLAGAAWTRAVTWEHRSGGAAAEVMKKATAEMTAEGAMTALLQPVAEPLLPLASPFPEEEEQQAEALKEHVEDPLAELVLLAEQEETAAAPESGTASVEISVSTGDPVGRVLELVNFYRAQSGLSALTLDSSLCSAASTRASEITRNFSHTRPDGSQWYTVSSLAHGENLVMGTDMNADGAMTKWMNSSGHRANILDGAYGTMGVGYYYSGREVYWVQLFGY